MVKQDYSYSFDINSHLINVNDAVKGCDYFCPCCGDIMIPRQGHKCRWHFAHKGNAGKCSYETYLHKIAKRRICECFNESSGFIIKLNVQATCAIKECPLGAKIPCTWASTNEFDLKQYYNYCEEEVSIDKYRADLLISNNQKCLQPILIEIFVTHKSTDKKLDSNYRIIEIRIESEEDIDKIVNTASIIESDSESNFLNINTDKKIQFYNFKRSNIKERPDIGHQQIKYKFWIDAKGHFDFDKIKYIDDIINQDGSNKCLGSNPSEIENAIFRIESRHHISWDFAFYILKESGLNIKYCAMCKFYRYNDLYGRPMCVLYKSKGTKQYPNLTCAKNCNYFKQIDYIHDERLYGIDYDQNVRLLLKNWDSDIS